MTLERFELITKIFSYIAVPIILGIIGWVIQIELSEKSLKREYFQIAVEVLNSPKTKDSEALRAWAIEFFKQNSPTSVPKSLIQSLNNGTTLKVVSIPVMVPCIYTKLEKPKWRFDVLPKNASVFEQVKALLIDRDERIIYESQLEAQIAGCE